MWVSADRQIHPHRFHRSSFVSETMPELAATLEIQKDTTLDLVGSVVALAVLVTFVVGAITSASSRELQGCSWVFLIIAVVSFALIMAIYEVLIRRFNIVRFFFGMRPKKKTAKVSAPRADKTAA